MRTRKDAPEHGAAAQSVAPAPLGGLAAGRLLALQRSAGNRAVGRLLRKGPVKLEDAAKAAGIDVSERPPSDEVDGFLDSRTGLFKVVLSGSQIRVTVSRQLGWTKRYTRRALTLAATAAAIRAIHGPDVPIDKIRQAHEKLLGSKVKYTPGTDRPRVEPEHMTIIDDAALSALENELGLVWERQSAKWRTRRSEARMLAFALESARRSWDKLAPHLSEQQLAAADITPELVRFMLEKRFETMVEVAKRDKAAAPWRAAFERTLNRGLGPHRHPQLEDFGEMPLSEWATIVLRLAVATRKALREQYERERAEDARHNRNEHLRPHRLKVDDPTRFVLDTYDPREQRLDEYGWVVSGGQALFNRKNEEIQLLAADSRRVVYQNTRDKNFYEQSLEGFGQELLYGIYTAAGRKSLGAIKLSKSAIGFLSAVFWEVRWTVIALDLLSIGVQLQTHRDELERNYARVKLAYENVEGLVPGLLPDIWRKVVSRENVFLVNPVANPDFAAWLKAAIRLVIIRVAYVVDMRYALDEVTGILSLVWIALKQAFWGLLDAIVPVLVVGTAVAKSSGVSQDRAARRIQQIGREVAAAHLDKIKSLSPSDQQRLVLEIQDLGEGGSELVATLKRALQG